LAGWFAECWACSMWPFIPPMAPPLWQATM